MTPDQIRNAALDEATELCLREVRYMLAASDKMDIDGRRETLGTAMAIVNLAMKMRQMRITEIVPCPV